MSIEDRNLQPGTTLVARYKKEEHRAEVVEGKDGKVVYRLSDGREFTSPSAAGSAVMGGVACNGWRFWSVEGAEEAKPAKPKGKAKTKGKGAAKVDGKPEEAVACGECKKEFPNSREAAEHMAEAHGAPEAAGNGAR
jgi:hypothetical protein